MVYCNQRNNNNDDDDDDDDDKFLILFTIQLVYSEKQMYSCKNAASQS